MTRTAALRFSVLVSLGLIPIACSGKTLSGGDDDDDDGGGRGGTGGALTGAAGKPIKGGAPSTGAGGALSTGTGGALSLGGSSSKAGSANVAGAAGESGVSHRCTNGKLDAITGLVSCDEGYLARPSAKRCEPPDVGAGGAGGEPSLPRADGSVSCVEDSDCAAFELGYCQADDEGGFGGATSFCESGCLSDADCGASSFCLCSAGSKHGGTCVASNCRTNDECGVGFVCASYSVPCGPDGFACTTKGDFCPASDCSADVCTFDRQLGHRICDDSVCGRPFLVEQQARVAPAVTSSAWHDQLAPSVDHLTAAQRAELAAHWTKLGQMEHASIAAFARFQLQLLALGAPPELVQACNQALIDETNHTRLCFGLASAYAGQGIGPGPLDVQHSLDVTSLADIVDLVIVEGCFGETNAALEALEAADRATDPVIRSAYARIAEDEQRHAELAFRFVRWALGRGDNGVRARITRAVATLPRRVAAQEITKPALEVLLTNCPTSSSLAAFGDAA